MASTLEVQQKLQSQVEDELERLEVSTNEDPCSGLMVAIVGHLDEDPDVALAKIYDDYADGVYCADNLLKHLKSISKASLVRDAEDNIWDLIRDCEA